MAQQNLGDYNTILCGDVQNVGIPGVSSHSYSSHAER